MYRKNWTRSNDLVDNVDSSSIFDYTMNLDHMELNWLMNSVTQISSLLKVAYGKAGSDIIKMSIMENNGGMFSSRGTKVNAVFAFCDIRR